MSVAVYGATGHTGRLVLAELARRDLRCVAGGRDARRLRAAADGHPNVAELRVAALDDPESLRAFLDGQRVVINCAGPFRALAAPVVSAAIESGTHYVDAAGDQQFIRAVFERMGPLAAQRGVALVPALGFECALGDCVARLAAAGHEPLDEVVVAYALAGSGVGADALGGGREEVAGQEVVYRDGDWGPPPGGVHRASFRFPPPLGRQPMQRYGSGEVITVPHHTRTRRVTTLVTASSWAPHPALVPLVPFARPLARRPFLRNRIAAVSRRVSPPSEADADARSSARFTIAAVARRAGATVGRALVEGRDFYALTGTTLAVGASRLATADGDRAGALGPADAFDPASFLDELAVHGVRWERA